MQPREINDREQCRMLGEVAVRRLAAELGREVLTVTGKFIAKFAKAQRSQRSRWPQPKLSRMAGRHRAYACGAPCLAPPLSCVARQIKQDSTQMNADKPG
jgi:hypothetical protein